MSPADGPADLDRATPDFAPANFRMLAFSTGRLIELDCGSNCPGRIVGPGKYTDTQFIRYFEIANKFLIMNFFLIMLATVRFFQDSVRISCADNMTLGIT